MDCQLSLHLSLDKHNGVHAHGLLEPPSVAYSSVTVRRAFVVWMYCGQTNKFKDVCNYFHHLEALEDTLPEESRASSRQHEFSLFRDRPPLSAYVANNFPTLYPAVTQQMAQNVARVESTKHKTRDINKNVQGNGTTKAEILEASIMIRDYCKRNMKSLKGFLKEFKEHTERCGLANTVGNISCYIKRKIIESEIQLEVNYSLTLELLTRNYKVNEDGDETFLECETQRKTDQWNSVILKKADSLNTSPVVTKKNSSEAEHIMSTNIFNTKPIKDNIEKLDNIYKKYANNEKSYLKSASYDFFDTFSYDNRHEPKVRTRKFSDSDLIIRDLMKSRKI